MRPARPAIIDEVPAGRLYKDGALLVTAEARTIADRKRLSFAGIVMVALAITDKGQLAADPEIELVGIPETTADGEAMADLPTTPRVETFETLPKPQRRDPERWRRRCGAACARRSAQHWGKKPNVTVHVLIV